MTAYEGRHAAEVRPATEDRWNTTMARLMDRVTEAVLTTDVAWRASGDDSEGQRDAKAELRRNQEYLTRTACKAVETWGTCWLAGGHPGQHIYTEAPEWVAA